MFNNPRYLTAGVAATIPEFLQLFMWQCVDRPPDERDYLQVFRLEPFGKMQQIRHTAEQPEHQMLYMIPCDEPITEKIYVIDDDDHSTMLLAEEYSRPANRRGNSILWRKTKWKTKEDTVFSVIMSLMMTRIMKLTASICVRPAMTSIPQPATTAVM